VAALKGAGLRRKIVPVEEKGGKQRPSEPAAKIRKVAAKIAEERQTEETLSNGDKFAGTVDGKGNLKKGAYTYADDGSVFDGEFKDNKAWNGTYTEANGRVSRIQDGETVEVLQEPTPEGPFEITLELAEGDRMTVPDGAKFLDKLDKDIGKYERFLACLNRK
jgi:hypothetical protein